MNEDSVKLARLWINLKETKDRLDNEIIPVSWHLGVEDWELIGALETASVKIGDHFERFKLTAIPVKKE
jgi:hypothetical protein